MSLYVVSQPPKQLYIFFKHINRDKQLQKKCFIVRKHILLCLKENKIIFPGDFTGTTPWKIALLAACSGQYHNAQCVVITVSWVFVLCLSGRQTSMALVFLLVHLGLKAYDAKVEFIIVRRRSHRARIS